MEAVQFKYSQNTHAYIRCVCVHNLFYTDLITWNQEEEHETL